MLPQTLKTALEFDSHEKIVAERYRQIGKQNFGTNGSHFFDDEGQLARKQIILDKGILSSPMNDLLSSLKGDINGPAPRQSNGKRESWGNPIMARQTNTYFTAGNKTVNELIAMVEGRRLCTWVKVVEE